MTRAAAVASRQPHFLKSDYAKVRRFFVKYRDRLLYGSDLTEDPPSAGARAQNPPTNAAQFRRDADAFWRSDWIYLATSGVQHIDAIKSDVKGLALPKRVIDKIYYRNAKRILMDTVQKKVTTNPRVSTMTGA